MAIIFGKGQVPNWSEEAFVIEKVENTVPWIYIICDFKSKTPNITNLATTTALTAVENKIPNVSNLVKKK